MKQAERLVEGAVWGICAWLAYFAGEYAATTLAPLVKDSNTALTELHWKLSLLLMAGYAVAGFLGGGLGALLLPGNRRDGRRGWRLRTMGSLTLILAFVANLTVTGRYRTALIAGTAFAGALLWSLTSEARAKSFRLLSNPWITAVLVLVLVRAGDSFRGKPLWMEIAAGILLSLLIEPAFLFGSRVTPARSPGVMRHSMVVFAGILIVLGSAFVLSRSHQGRDLGRFAAGGRGQRPNVVVLVMDTVRADHLSVYGYGRKTTPQLEKLAESATYFPNAYASGNGTLVSHSAMFTGTYASWNGVRSHASRTSAHAAGPMRTDSPTFAEVLSKHEYSTMGVVANTAFLTPAFGFHRGFDWFDYSFAIPMHTGEADAYYLRHGARKLMGNFTCVAEFDLRYLRAREINRKALRLVDLNRSTGRPFFLFLNYMDAHGPYIPPAPYDTLFPGKDCAGKGLSDPEAGRKPSSEAERQHLISQYDGGIAYEDAEIGRFIDDLKQRGLYDDTLIIVTSDHGEAFGEGGRYGHGQTVYADQVNVPMLIKFPHQRDRRVTPQAVGLTDMLPTIFRIAGIEAPPHVQGLSTVRPEDIASGRRLLSEDLQSEPPNRALYAAQFKFIGSAENRELYNLPVDPHEQTDVCSQQAAICTQMQKDLEEWVRSIPAKPVKDRTVDRKTMDRLKSLGYIAP